ncbi:helix-turn-helix domain-containing protein [Haladaptatus halobius]|uniref:helix-turn-helix domain-containing protein n=1 Tax=Haladaptatus halobius TaxID=2884875 RepID=UPI001D0A8989|nr:helix-turn-helix domain-containing protein [Haladaptatus halobius]
MTTGTVAEVEIPADEFALGQTLSTIDGLTVEIERVVAHSNDHLMPFVWVSDKNHEATEAVLAEDPSVKHIELLVDLKDERLYRMEWVDQIEMLVQLLTEEEGTMLAARGAEQSWHFRILVPERAALSRTYEHCQEHGLSLTIRNLYRLEDGRHGRFGLTKEQQEMLILAHEHGYYTVPREIDASDLADELGISHQAVSERLRRGHEKLMKNTLISKNAE